MPDRPLTATELTAMFEATDNAELARQERALRAEQADRLPEIQARAAKARAGSVDVDWLIGEVVRLRAETQTLGTEKGLLEERFAQLVTELDRLRNAVAAHIWDGMTTHDNGLAASVATLQVALTKAGIDLTAEVDHLADAEREAGREDYEEAVS